MNKNSQVRCFKRKRLGNRATFLLWTWWCRGPAPSRSVRTSRVCGSLLWCGSHVVRGLRGMGLTARSPRNGGVGLLARSPRKFPRTITIAT